jgi:hypothetical protein
VNREVGINSGRTLLVVRPCLSRFTKVRRRKYSAFLPVQRGLLLSLYSSRTRAHSPMQLAAAIREYTFLLARSAGPGPRSAGTSPKFFRDRTITCAPAARQLSKLFLCTHDFLLARLDRPLVVTDPISMNSSGQITLRAGLILLWPRGYPVEKYSARDIPVAPLFLYEIIAG